MIPLLLQVDCKLRQVSQPGTLCLSKVPNSNRIKITKSGGDGNPRFNRIRKNKTQTQINIPDVTYKTGQNLPVRSSKQNNDSSVMY